ncbi:MAG: pirin family protein [Pseudomonadota bacterium]
MSDLIAESAVSDSKDCPDFSQRPILQKIPTHNAQVGDNLTIRRALPSKARRMIGAWCFLDHFGPMNLAENGGLSIGPHPHMGLQTFTWTINGEILHRDSLGSEQVIHPGEVNLMTAGKGISHSEESLPNGILEGVQLWIAMPDTARHNAPEFAHYTDLPTWSQDEVKITLLAGELDELRAPTKIYTPLIGMDLHALKNTSTTLAMNPKFEYGVLVLQGKIIIEAETLTPGTLMYLGCGRKTLPLQFDADTRLIIIGGEPFAEEILMWWNFVGRTREEMVTATREWEQHERFGEVQGYQGNRLDAPAVPPIK